MRTRSGKNLVHKRTTMSTRNSKATIKTKVQCPLPVSLLPTEIISAVKQQKTDAPPTKKKERKKPPKNELPSRPQPIKPKPTPPAATRSTQLVTLTDCNGAVQVVMPME